MPAGTGDCLDVLAGQAVEPPSSIPEHTVRTIAGLLKDATRTLSVVTMPYHA